MKVPPLEVLRERIRLPLKGVVYLNVKVVPKASRTELVEVTEGPEGEEVLKVRVAAVPEKGRANAELCSHLAELFGVPKATVTVSQGHRSQRKVIKVQIR